MTIPEGGWISTTYAPARARSGPPCTAPVHDHVWLQQLEAAAWCLPQAMLLEHGFRGT